jgi:cytochrome c-type biogenesis protein CcmH/NrfF
MRLTLLILVLAVMLAPLTVYAQLGGEDLPAGVTGDDVYRVSSKMYCDVCAGVPVSACASPTCAAWRQEVAMMLGEGFTDDEILQEFAVLYGDEISGVPLGGSDRTIALALPALLAALTAVVIVWQVLQLRQRGSSRAQVAAAEAGLNADFERPVPDNVDPDYLERFLHLLEEHQTR